MTGRKHSGSTMAGTASGKGVAYTGPGNAALPARKPSQEQVDRAALVLIVDEAGHCEWSSTRSTAEVADRHADDLEALA